MTVLPEIFGKKQSLTVFLGHFFLIMPYLDRLLP
ncbi:hypothetical protein SAMN05421863_100850 [Nitrosomonas communis]|uniref:Uncharacterized protein n=1 Tax=Nitrosomonas communis TaxID=44574 RepID=A0A1I4M386_9PROT|nr:hypothetical protein SAMN05421863_100850 [Nitrosomonas communis]